MWLDTFTVSAAGLTALANLFLAIYVYKKNPKERINVNFFYFGLSIFLWCCTNFTNLIVQNLFWLRATYSIGSVVAIAGIFFGYTLADKKIHKWAKIFLFTTGAALFIVDLFTPFLVKSVISFSALGYNVNFGFFFYIWGVVLIFLVLVALYAPFRVRNKVGDQRKKQILYFLTGAGTFAAWAIIVSVILPFLGFAGLSDFDSPATIFMVGFTSYAIIKYHLMNITSLFFQAFIYSLVIVVIIAALLLLMFIGSFFLQHLLVWPIYVIVFLVSVALFFIGRLFFIEKKDLEEAKINLTESLEKSEANRRRAETERDKTATIISSFSDGLILLDEKDRIFSINPEAEKILGLDPSRLLEKPFQSLADFSMAKSVVSVLNTGLNNVSKREVELSKSFIIELSVIPLNLDEKDIGHLIVLHDVSREKIVEKTKTEFVSLAAHQLRTPLSIIKWSMSMLKGGDFGKLNKKQAEVIRGAFKNNERLISLVNDLLNVSRIEEGRYLYKVAITDVRKIVELVIDGCKDEIKNKKIKLNFKEPDSPLRTMLDAEKMKLVVQNLTDNAIKYSPEGGKIEITLKSGGKIIEFGIQDFGIGIPKNQQGKVFTKFFRGDNAAKVNTTGTGLGLFLVQNIIEAHGGKIWFESEENVGTSFHFSLPIKKGVV